jgi:hypothetical protein
MCALAPENRPASDGNADVSDVDISSSTLGTSETPPQKHAFAKFGPQLKKALESKFRKSTLERAEDGKANILSRIQWQCGPECLGRQTVWPWRLKNRR